jgi:polar amino acid transport system substrate-binding protein
LLVPRVAGILAAVALAVVAGCTTPAGAPDPALQRLLAPSGKLRVGVYPGSPTSIIDDPASGGAKGVGHDLGRELAQRLGVPFEPVVFAKNADVLAAVKLGQVDVTFTNATAARAKDMDFSAPLLEVEQGYLVPPGSPVTALAEVDRPGIRVGVSEGSTSESVLSQELRHARVVRSPTIKEAIGMLSAGKLDAFATNKAILFEMSDELPGSRVLGGRWGLERFAFGIPKGREQGLDFVNQFAKDAEAEGLVIRAVDRAGLRGTLAAPPR